MIPDTGPALDMTKPLSCSLIHIVEDDDAVRQALAFLIESFGATVVAHRSAEDFLATYGACASQSPACLLLDLHLEDRNGADLLEHLEEEHCPTPAIILTAHPNSDLAGRARRAGARRVIEKPFRSGELLGAISELLEPS